MHDFTNLAWPEAPFGAEQRPFGKRSAILTAITFEWRSTAEQAAPVLASVATVYLRVRRDGKPLDVSDETLALGFRASVAEGAADVPALLDLTDRAITRARRHAAILVGHRLVDDLERLAHNAPAPLRGITGLKPEWHARSAKVGGIARMVDTAYDLATTAADLQLTTEDDSTPNGAHNDAQEALSARHALCRALTLGMMAAAHLGRYRWSGAFRTGYAIDRLGWDVLASPAFHHENGPFVAHS